MITLVIMARVTADAQVKDAGEVKITSFAMAHETSKKGEKKTDFFEIRAWGTLAEWAGKYVKKGKRYAVYSDNMGYETYTNKEGNKVNKLVITASRIEFADGADKTEMGE